jgi:hypothetical protein
MSLEQYQEAPESPPTNLDEYLQAKKEGRWLSKSHILLAGAKTAFGHITPGWLYEVFRRGRKKNGVSEFKDAVQYILHYPDQSDQTEFDPDIVRAPRKAPRSHPSLSGVAKSQEPRNMITIYQCEPPLILKRLPGGKKPGKASADKIFDSFRSIQQEGSTARPYRVMDLQTGEVLKGYGIPPRYPEECLKNLLQEGRRTIALTS